MKKTRRILNLFSLKKTKGNIILSWFVIIASLIGLSIYFKGTTDVADKNDNNQSSPTSESLKGQSMPPYENKPDESEESEGNEDFGDNGDFENGETISAMSTETIKNLPAGTMIATNNLGDIAMDDLFYYQKIDDKILSRISGISYGEGCTVPLDDLRYVKVLYHGFDQNTYIGELIVNKAIAQDITDIFEELYETKYPIERMVLIDEYQGDDNASMAANNTSSFNYRTVSGTTRLSNHAYGLAIDINPLYNPYVKYGNPTIIQPEEGAPYADRSLDNPYYIRENDVCFKAFTKRGFTWGGFWTEKPDYQHFQKIIK